MAKQQTLLYINVELYTKWPTTLLNFMSSHIKNFEQHNEISATILLEHIFYRSIGRFTC